MTLFSRVNQVKFKSDKTTRRFLTTLVVLTLFAAFAFKFLFLPDKYFYDSQHVLDVMYNPNAVTDGSYSFAANFFNFFNFFNINSVIGRSSIILVLTFFFVLYINKKFPLNGLGSNIFYFCTIFIMEIYVFTISKEFVQFLFYILIFLVCYNVKNSKLCNILLYVILALIGIFFRSYYLILLGCVVIYDFLRMFKVSRGIRMTAFVVLIVAGLAVAQVILPNQYNTLVSIRHVVNNGGDISNMQDRATLILDVINNPNNNLFIFILNYIINFIRMVFPIELVIKGKLLYLFFTIYQIITVSILFTIGKNEKYLSLRARKIAKIVFFYFCVLAIFEPDFGSFARHGCLGSFLLLYPIYELERIKSKNILVVKKHSKLLDLKCKARKY